jgi:hypothetical protein
MLFVAKGLPMKAIDSPFTKIINGTTQFVIPVFQRDYTWDAETQCAQLWRDVLHAAGTGNARGHFLGSICTLPQVTEQHEQAVAALQAPKCPRAVASKSMTSPPVRQMHSALPRDRGRH